MTIFCDNQKGLCTFTVYVGNVPGTGDASETKLCGQDSIRTEAGGTISAIGCRCLVLGSVVTLSLETTVSGAVISRVAVFGLPKDRTAVENAISMMMGESAPAPGEGIPYDWSNNCNY